MTRQSTPTTDQRPHSGPFLMPREDTEMSIGPELKRLGDQVSHLEHQAQQYKENAERFKCERDQARRERDQMEAENAELRAGQGRWPNETIPAEHVPFKGMTDLRYKEPEDDFPCCSSHPTGYADDDHQDAEVTQWHEPSSRLTVHKLNVAPVGSWLARLFHNSRKKGDDGRWHKAWMFEGQRAETSEELIANGWADATLTYPEQS